MPCQKPADLVCGTARIDTVAHRTAPHGQAATTSQAPAKAGRPAAQAAWPVSGVKSSDGNTTPVKTAMPTKCHHLPCCGPFCCCISTLVTAHHTNQRHDACRVPAFRHSSRWAGWPLVMCGSLVHRRGRRRSGKCSACCRSSKWGDGAGGSAMQQLPPDPPGYEEVSSGWMVAAPGIA